MSKFHIKCSCIKCKKETTTGQLTRNHKDKCPNTVKYLTTKGRIAWNKGLTKADERVRKNGESVSKNLKEQFRLGIMKPYIPTATERLETSIRQSLHNSGGKCKWYDVNGIKVQGTWELNLALKFEELKICWSKPKTNKDLFTYIIGNSVRSYAPDFYLPEFDLYLEVKGFWWGNDKEKMRLVIEQNPDKNILIIEKIEYERILQGELVWL